MFDVIACFNVSQLEESGLLRLDFAQIFEVSRSE